MKNLLILSTFLLLIVSTFGCSAFTEIIKTQLPECTIKIGDVVETIDGTEQVVTKVLLDCKVKTNINNIISPSEYRILDTDVSFECGIKEVPQSIIDVAPSGYINFANQYFAPDFIHQIFLKEGTTRNQKRWLTDCSGAFQNFCNFRYEFVEDVGEATSYIDIDRKNTGSWAFVGTDQTLVLSGEKRPTLQLEYRDFLDVLIENDYYVDTKEGKMHISEIFGFDPFKTINIDGFSWRNSQVEKFARLGITEEMTSVTRMLLVTYHEFLHAYFASLHPHLHPNLFFESTYHEIVKKNFNSIDACMMIEKKKECSGKELDFTDKIDKYSCLWYYFPEEAFASNQKEFANLYNFFISSGDSMNAVERYPLKPVNDCPNECSTFFDISKKSIDNYLFQCKQSDKIQYRLFNSKVKPVTKSDKAQQAAHFFYKLSCEPMLVKGNDNKEINFGPLPLEYLREIYLGLDQEIETTESLILSIINAVDKIGIYKSDGIKFTPEKVKQHIAFKSKYFN